MDAKQLRCIELMILNPELTQQELADKVGVHINTITNWKKTDEFNQELRRCFDECWKEMALKAQLRMNQLMDSTNDSVALGASKYVMDSYGRGAVQKLDLTSKGKTLVAVKASEDESK